MQLFGGRSSASLVQIPDALVWLSHWRDCMEVCVPGMEWVGGSLCTWHGVAGGPSHRLWDYQCKRGSDQVSHCRLLSIAIVASTPQYFLLSFLWTRLKNFRSYSCPVLSYYLYTYNKLPDLYPCSLQVILKLWAHLFFSGTGSFSLWKHHLGLPLLLELSQNLSWPCKIRLLLLFHLIVSCALPNCSL